MVAVRNSHFGKMAQKDPEAWVKTLGLEVNDQNTLLKNYQKVMLLCPQRSQIHLLELGTEMVEILISLNMDLDTLNAALIFPLLDHNKILTTEEAEELWGKNIAQLVKGATDMEGIRALQTRSKECVGPAQADNLRHMLLAMVEDVRAVVIKLAERICFLRLIKNDSEEIKVIAAREVDSIYAPLANRLGIGQLKWELEDLAFSYLKPVIYKKIAKQLSEKRLDREHYISDFVGQIDASLKEMEVVGKAYGRPKHIYSIYHKMKKKNLQFDQLFDVRAVRVVVEKVQDCYAALGAIHTNWHHIPSEFDDYVANPKPNGYQSIHSIVLGDGGKAIEIQIRTQKMHDDAELGVAAHWKYKEGSAGGKSANGYEEKIAWLRKILAWQEELSDGDDLIAEVHSEVFDDRVYVFTPKGEVIDLPTGSTPLDFAYYIHSQIGHRCKGAKISNAIVPFTYQLKTGDQVEVLTQKEENPSRDWLNPTLGYLKSPRARQKVAVWFRKLDRDKNIIAGRELLEIELAKVNLQLNDIDPAVKRFNVGCHDDIFAGIGNGDLRIHQLVNFLDELINIKTLEEQDQAALKEIEKRQKNTPQKSNGSDIIIDGVGNLMHSVARCCQPIPGENIAGYITQGRGISIHKASCVQLADLIDAHPERFIPATWGEGASSGYMLSLRLEALDRDGLMKDITVLFASEKIGIVGLNFSLNQKKQIAVVDISIEMKTKEGVTQLIAKLKLLKDVLDVWRL